MIELVIVIAVLAILVTFGAITYRNVTQTAQDVAIKTDMTVICSALDYAEAKEGLDIYKSLATPAETYISDLWGNKVAVSGLILYNIGTGLETYYKKITKPLNNYYADSNNNIYYKKDFANPRYKNPPRPNGFIHTIGNWNDGYVIQDTSGNEWVWVPVGNLPSGLSRHSEFHGTGEDYTYYWDGTTSGTAPFSETADMEDIATVQDIIKKEGGFYIMRYEASNNGGKAQSKAAAPYVNINWADSKSKAENMDSDYSYPSNTTTHLLFGAEWDATAAWLESSGGITTAQKSDGSGWGNYDADGVAPWTRGIWSPANNVAMNTGSRSETMKNNIYDISGNVWEWTMEKNTNASKDAKGAYAGSGALRVFRGGGWDSTATGNPIINRESHPSTRANTAIGFRCALVVNP
jgi:formylglycine-generating enzyme required for sulfatase activity